MSPTVADLTIADNRPEFSVSMSPETLTTSGATVIKMHGLNQVAGFLAFVPFIRPSAIQAVCPARLNLDLTRIYASGAMDMDRDRHYGHLAELYKRIASWMSSALLMWHSGNKQTERG